MTQKNYYSLRDTNLIFRSATLELDLGGETQTIDALAQYLMLKGSPKSSRAENLALAVDEIIPSELERVVAQLRVMNGISADETTISGRVNLPYDAAMGHAPRSSEEEEYVFQR